MTLIPSTLASCKVNSQAERKIFERAIESKLLNRDDCYFFYSLRIQEAGIKLVGEVDFVYLDDKFILFFEIKGGPVRYLSDINQWSVMGGAKVADPFMQVTDYLFSLRNYKFPEIFPHKNFSERLIFGYGVLFPDASKSINQLDYSKSHKFYANEMIEYNLNLIYFAEDHIQDDSLTKYINRIKKYWSEYPKYSNSKRVYGISRREKEQIRDYFRKDLIFEVPLINLLNEDEKEVNHYTDQQLKALETFEYNRKKGGIILGGPGTGKTVLAIERLKQVTAEGQKTLFICYNKTLAAFLRNRIKELKIKNAEVYNIHKFYEEKLKAVSLLPRENISDEEFWHQVVPLQFKNWFNSLNLDKYDYLIIDEGQDIFNEYHLDAMNCLLDGGLESGNWAIFMDKEYQSIYYSIDVEFYEYFLAAYPCFVIPLLFNCRNTDEMIKKAYYHTGIPKIDCLRKSKLNTETKVYNSDPELYEKVIEKVWSLIHDGVNRHDITVLMPTNENITLLIQANPDIFDYLNDSNVNFRTGKINVSTIHSFKGLENQIIILAGLDKYDPDDKKQMSLLYVAHTRAKSQLIIFVSRTIHEKFTERIIERINKEE